MADSIDLTKVKSKLSKRLLNLAGVSGVGIRGSRIVVYLADDDPGVRRRAEEVAREAGVPGRLVFDVAGEFRKQ